MMTLFVCLIVSLIAFRSARPRVTHSNFTTIQVGETLSDIEELLGSPHMEQIEYGMVSDRGNYGTNSSLGSEELESRGYRQLKRLQWTSLEITIIVVCDLDDTVVCRYKSEGQVLKRRRWWQRWASWIAGEV